MCAMFHAGNLYKGGMKGKVQNRKVATLGSDCKIIPRI
jgi:hypothetical protein